MGSCDSKICVNISSSIMAALQFQYVLYHYTHQENQRQKHALQKHSISFSVDFVLVCHYTVTAHLNGEMCARNETHKMDASRFTVNTF